MTRPPLPAVSGPEPYDDRDDTFLALRQVVRESYAALRRPAPWTFGRFENWRYGGNALARAETPGYLCRMAWLWRDADGTVAGFCLREGEDAGIEMLTRPGRRDLEDAMLAWIARRAPDDGPRETYAMADDAERAARCRAAGFVAEGSPGVMWGFDLGRRRPAPAPPADLRSTSFAEEPSEARAASLVRAIGAAFGRSFPPAIVGHLLQAPGLRPERLRFLVDRDGEVVAFCHAWIDAEARVAELDPIGVVPERQRQGLGRWLVLDTMAWLAARGVRDVWIGAGPEPARGNRPYERCDPDQRLAMLTWRLS